MTVDTTTVDTTATDTTTKAADTTATTLVTKTEPAAPPDWRATLPDAVRDLPELTKYKTLEDFAKGHVEQSKLVGRKALTPPDKDSTPEQITAWRKALGIPDTPEGYFAAGVKLPEIAADAAWDKATEKAFLDTMHRLHAPPAVVQAALSIYGTLEAQKQQTAVRETQAASQELRRELGPQYDASLGRANRAIQEFGGDALVESYARTGA